MFPLQILYAHQLVVFIVYSA